MPLSDKGILAARERGDIVIEPFDIRNLGTDSYDVRLGDTFFTEKDEGSRELVFNMFGENCVRGTWEMCKAVPWEMGFADGWKPGDRFFPLEPGETILAHTQEFIGAVRGHTTKMFARSSVGRAMIGVCKCAGRGDVGFFNRWTMEITSFSRHHMIPLKVGMRIAQIEFLPVGETLRCYGATHGKYQGSSDLAEVMASWRPEMMLPRLDKDWELQNG